MSFSFDNIITSNPRIRNPGGFLIFDLFGWGLIERRAYSRVAYKII